MKRIFFCVRETDNNLLFENKIQFQSKKRRTKNKCNLAQPTFDDSLLMKSGLIVFGLHPNLVLTCSMYSFILFPTSDFCFNDAILTIVVNESQEITVSTWRSIFSIFHRTTCERVVPIRMTYLSIQGMVFDVSDTFFLEGRLHTYHHNCIPLFLYPQSYRP